MGSLLSSAARNIRGMPSIMGSSDAFSACRRSKSHIRTPLRQITSAWQSFNMSPCGDIRSYGVHLTPVPNAMTVNCKGCVSMTQPARMVHSYLCE